MKINKTFIFNILIYLILIYVIFMFQQYYSLCGHEYFMTSWKKGSSFFDFFMHFDRKFPAILCYIIINFLPEFLNIHPQDFVTGIGEFIKAVLYFLVCYSAAIGFFINSKKNIYGIISDKIFFLILPLSVFLFLMPNVYFFAEYKSCYIIEETLVYTEYFVCLLFYFLFFISLLHVIFKEEKINTKLSIFIIINSFLIGCWNELYNVSVLFSILFFTGITAIFYRKKLLKKELLLYFIIPFFIGFAYFYLSSQYMSGTTVAFRTFHWNEIIQNIDFTNFINEYVKYMFLNTIYFYIIIFLSVVFLIKCRNEKLNLIIITCLSIVLGYLITNFVFIIFSEIDHGCFFSRTSNQCVSSHILSFVTIILAGCIYYRYEKKQQYLICLFVLILSCLVFKYCNYNKIAQEVILERRILTYRIEKICLIYSLFGESAILPESYLDNNFELIRGDKDKFYEESVYYTYARNQYNTDFNGYIFKDDEYAFKELNKRLNILNEKFETNEELRKNNVSFKSLNKYKGFKFTLKDLEKIKKTKENSDILLKERAYINYRNDNLTEAANLYNKYLKTHNYDYDSLIKLNDIYLKLNKTKELNDLYKKIFMSGKMEMIFLRKWLYLNYNVIEDYNTALMINQYIIDLTKENNQDWYVNKAIILLQLNKKEEAEKLFEYIKENLKDSERSIINLMKENNISSYEDIYKQSKLQLLRIEEKEV